MPRSTMMLMSNTGDTVNVVGPALRVDRFHGFTDGIYTISMSLQDFVGRIYLDASLADKPSETDWFPVWLRHSCQFVQYPLRPQAPTGTSGGDTGVDAYAFEGKFLWVRARLDRTYLGFPPGPNIINTTSIFIGVMDRILIL